MRLALPHGEGAQLPEYESSQDGTRIKRIHKCSFSTVGLLDLRALIAWITLCCPKDEQAEKKLPLTLYVGCLLGV